MKKINNSHKEKVIFHIKFYNWQNKIPPPPITVYVPDSNKSLEKLSIQTFVVKMEDKRQAAERCVQNKKNHPFENAGTFSMLFYCWMLPLFYMGMKKDLTEENLPPPLKVHDSKILGDRLEESWLHEVNNKINPSLWRAIWRVFWKEFFFTGIIWILLETIIKGSQPLCMSRLLEYYRPNSTMTLDEAYTYAGLIILVIFLQVIVGHYYLLNILQLGLKIRVATCSLVYRKALKLSKSALAETTVGQMVNLISNDVSRFDTATVQFHCLWYCPIQAVIVMYLCYIYLGPTAMTGVLLLVLFIPFQMWMARKVSIFRHKTATRTDERIRLMNEIISGIMVIKMYTWEKPFAKLVELSRRKELQQIRNISYIRAVIGSLNLFLNRCAIYLCLLTFVLIGNVPTAQYVYTLTTFYNLLQYAITILFPQGITQFAEVSISIKRIHTFLMYEEVEKQIQIANEIVKLNNATEEVKYSDATHNVQINIKKASAKWIVSQPENTLNNINLKLDSNKLLAVVGPVGSSKTSLLHVILKELSLNEGSIIVTGTISYASQEPWLFAANIRQNIIFGEDFSQKKYQEVVKVCALETDFSLFPFGDKTIAGERGVALSGGQKARINLARAVYKDADIYLLDDPLSAVDAHVGRHIFDECITGYLRNKCVVLVTHQLQYLHNVENIYLIENGRVRASGTYEEMQKSGQEFTKLLNEHKEEQEKVDGENEKQEEEEELESKESKDEPVLEKENRETGTISWKVYMSYIAAGGHWCKILVLLSGFILSQISASLSDYFQTFWVNLEQEHAMQESQVLNTPSILNTTTRIEMDSSLWGIIGLSEKNCLIIYSILIGLTVTVTVTRSFVFYRFSIKASLRLHNSMFDKIVYATIRFFNTNSSGRILNRFSKDMGSIDERLPLILLETIQIAFIVLAVSIMIGSLNPWMYLPTLIILVIFYLLRIVYLRTSRDVKRLEGTARSPIYSHLNASLQGLTTIRAFGAQEMLKQEFDNYQNLHSSTWFIAVCAARTFGVWLDIHCIAYIALVTLSFLFLQTEIFGGNVGLAITQALSLTGMFQWGMRQWSELENQMTCVERVKEYADVDPEKDEGAINPPKNWPEKGNIRFENVCLKYDTNGPYILKKLNFTVNSTEKVGIVGRTGAGKSSIIAALFRLAIIDGKIIIDNIDAKSVSLNKLRSAISIIPQEPVLFSGTLRKNLDPFDEYTDKILWNSLEDVELKGVVSDLPQGLESKVVEGGANFSVGQRQLICLARAIVRSNKILVLDEATANVDPQTDALIQLTIRKKFFDCTVLTIAHRLHTVMDSDKVLVMDDGKVVEFGHPYALLQRINGKFHGLVKQTGKSMMKKLFSIAKENASTSSREVGCDYQ